VRNKFIYSEIIDELLGEEAALLAHLLMIVFGLEIMQTLDLKFTYRWLDVTS
jgi:hypothetical protein